MVCWPAKAFNFYSGHPDVCTAIIIIIIMVQLVSCRRCFFVWENNLWQELQYQCLLWEIEDNDKHNNSNSNNTTLIVLSPYEALTWLKIPTGRREPVSYFKSVAEDLNLRLPRTNPANSQGGTWTRGFRITVEPLLWDTSIQETLPFRRHKIWSWKNVLIILLPLLKGPFYSRERDTFSDSQNPGFDLQSGYTLTLKTWLTTNCTCVNSTYNVAEMD